MTMYVQVLISLHPSVTDQLHILDHRQQMQK